MRVLLSVVLVGGVVAQAAAADYDTRLYITPSVGYIDADRSRGEDDGISYSIGIGKPLSNKRNVEVEVAYDDLDDTELLNLNARMITFFDRGQSLLYSVTGIGWLNADGGPGVDYDSVALTSGLGLTMPESFGFLQHLKLEGLIRADLHFDKGAGTGGKDIFIEPLVRLGYSIPIGAKPRAKEPEPSEVAVVEPAERDGDGDGVPDSLDLCPGTPAGTVVDKTGCAPSMETSAVDTRPDDCREPAIDEAVDEYGCAVDRAVILNDVNFEFDSATLTAEAKLVLDDVAQVLSGMPDPTVEIAGHTSDEGDSLYNLDLSQRRAAAVRRYLINNGVSADRLVAKGYGDEAPISNNDSIEGRRENRRVEVKIVR